MELDFDFLWWLELVLFFPEDLRKEIVRLTGDDVLAYAVSRSEAVKRCSVAQLYYDFGRGERWFETLICRVPSQVEELQTRTMFFMKLGSHLYGTSTQKSDHNYKVVHV